MIYDRVSKQILRVAFLLLSANYHQNQWGLNITVFLNSPAAILIVLIGHFQVHLGKAILNVLGEFSLP